MVGVDDVVVYDVLNVVVVVVDDDEEDRLE
jgi:hypothetical protein